MIKMLCTIDCIKYFRNRKHCYSMSLNNIDKDENSLTLVLNEQMIISRIILWLNRAKNQIGEKKTFYNLKVVPFSCAMFIK